jgi:transposase InsO family protein
MIWRMFRWPFILFRLAAAILKSRRNLLLENLALSHQLLVLGRNASRPRLNPLDRALWAWLSHTWNRWRIRLLIVQPDTVIQWHREGFRLFWKWKSRPAQPGRKTVAADTITLIRNLSQSNPLWGAPRIHGELFKLRITVAQRTVGKYMLRPPRGSSTQNWKMFLRNHLGQTLSVDFLTVPTFRLQRLYVFIVLSHQRRKVLHFNVTEAPSAHWTAQQLRETFAFTWPPRYLLRDRDGIYGLEFQVCSEALGLQEVLIAPRCPWQSPYVERLIGSVRRECLDHVIVLNRAHLHRVLESYFAYYHRCRTHLSLGKDAPQARRVQPPEEGKIIAFPEVGGLHHRYERRAA